MPKEITVKVALFAPNPMRCFNCNKFGHTSRRCKVAAKCHWCGKDKSMKVSVRDPSCALIEMVPMPHRVNIARSGRRRKNSACPRWKTHLLSGSQTVEAKMPTVVSGGKSLLPPPGMKWNLWSVKCHWLGGFRTAHSGKFCPLCILLADPDRYWPALRLPPGSRGRHRPTPGFRASPRNVKSRIRVQPIPPKQSLGVQQVPPKPRPRKMTRHHRGAHRLGWRWRGSWWTSRGLYNPGAPLLRQDPGSTQADSFGQTEGQTEST